MAQLFSNNAQTTLAADITAAALSLTVPAGKGALFPAPSNGDYFLATLYTTDANGNITANEIVKVTANAGDTFTIVRAQEGTAAQAWSAATAKIMLGLTAGVMGDVLLYTALHGSGVWYTSSCNTTDTASFNVNELVLIPFYVPVGGARYDQIAMEYTSGAAGLSVQLGIYSTDGDGYPKDLLLDAGNLPCVNPSFTTVALTIDVVLPGGYVWLAALPLGGTLSARRNLDAGAAPIPAVSKDEALSSERSVGMRMSGLAALPATLTRASLAQKGQVMRIAIRRA